MKADFAGRALIGWEHAAAVLLTVDGKMVATSSAEECGLAAGSCSARDAGADFAELMDPMRRLWNLAAAQ